MLTRTRTGSAGSLFWLHHLPSYDNGIGVARPARRQPTRPVLYDE